MKEIKEHALKDISGGSMTSDLLNFFRHGIFGSDSADGSEHQKWASSSTAPVQSAGKGEEYGLALVTGLVAIAAVVATGIKFLSGK